MFANPMTRPRGVCRVWLFASRSTAAGPPGRRRARGSDGDVVDRSVRPVGELHRELDAAHRQFDDQPLAERLPQRVHDQHAALAVQRAHPLQVAREVPLLDEVGEGGLQEGGDPAFMLHATRSTRSTARSGTTA